jgi:hypothetical protein
MLPSQCQCMRFLDPCSNATKQALPRKTFTETRPPRRVNAAYIRKETKRHSYGRCLLRNVHLQQDRRRIIFGSLRPHFLQTRPKEIHCAVVATRTFTARSNASLSLAHDRAVQLHNDNKNTLLHHHAISAVAQCAPHLLSAFTPSAAVSCTKSSRTKSYLPSCAAQCTAVHLQHNVVIGASATRPERAGVGAQRLLQYSTLCSAAA